MNSNGILGELERRLFVLDRMYSLYEEVIEPFGLACELRCSSCCTCNLTMTTLEGYGILTRVNRDELNRLLENVRAVSNNPRFQPQTTINGFAQLCRDGKPLPDENIDPSWGNCPLLTNKACPIYWLRPFGCRCMVSSLNCRDTGHAQVDEYILTINNLFLQYIEHIDPLGGTGSLIDILLYFGLRAHLEAYQRRMAVTEDYSLAPNRPIPVLMIPPEHRQRVQIIFKKLQDLVSRP